MRILVTGATGLIGSRLCEELLRSGHQVRATTRDLPTARQKLGLPVEWRAWDTRHPLPAGTLDGIDAVVHLAGESVASGRWTEARKAEILNSRSQSTRLLVEAIQSASRPPQVFLSASAVGYYGETADSAAKETSPRGQGFLCEVVEAWEKASEALAIRRCVFRIGVVLSRSGGALEKLEPLFRAGLGGKLGGGRQWMSWIHVDDVVSLFMEALRTPTWKGVYNAVAPHPVRNREFTRILAHALHRPALAPVPSLALRVAVGEMAQVLLESQRVEADRLMAAGYAFRFTTLEQALADLFPNGDRVLEASQWVPRPIEQVFPFFSEAKNLEQITPEFLNFNIVDVSTPQIELGTRIRYKLKIRGVPAGWLTHISAWSPPHRFVDEQEKGPYAKWHHTHSFEPMAGGTLLKDRVLFRLPVGFLGDVVAGALVKNDVSKIFQFRRQKITELFGGPAP
jgi:uncharacterized protein (TIGR01777 family)